MRRFDSCSNGQIDTNEGNFVRVSFISFQVFGVKNIVVNLTVNDVNGLSMIILEMFILELIIDSQSC